MKINPLFLERMKQYLKNEYEAFEKTLAQPVPKGFVENTLKSRENFTNFKKHPFLKDYYFSDELTGKSIEHVSGKIYFQEPSAASVVETLQVSENDKVLDLCSAPGGKSLQIAKALNHSGLLVCNEYDRKRCQILLGNIERLGIENYILTNLDTKIIAKQFQGFFDKVLVDAPCSGESMMKKHEKACDWSLEKIKKCSQLQLKILEDAYHCCKENGIIVYSTCTYAMEENEEVIAKFLEKYPDVELLPTNLNGRRGFDYSQLDASKLTRIFPMDYGMGHFIAKMQKKGKCSVNKISLKKASYHQIVEKWLVENVVEEIKYWIIENKVYTGSQYYDCSCPIVRQGILMGEIKNGRFEPAHHLYLSSTLTFKNYYQCDLQQFNLYMHGNALEVILPKGYYALTYQNHCFGFGKSDGQYLKNKYPKGLRWK